MHNRTPAQAPAPAPARVSSVAMPAVDPPAHDPEVEVTLASRVRWLAQNQDITGHDVAEQVARMWRDWTPLLDEPAADGSRLWVFTHPEHGWAVTYLPHAERAWKHNQQKAVLMADQFSASGTTVLTVLERLHGRGQSPARRAAVQRLLDCPAVMSGHDVPALRVLLALRTTPSPHEGDR